MKRQIFGHKRLTGLLGLMLLFTVGAAVAQRPVLRKKTVVKRKVIAKPAEPVFTVVSGTVFRSRMNSTISSKTARAGDTFTVTVTEPVYSSNGVVVVPTGSTLTGRVNTVTPAAKEGKPGAIDASFTRLTLPNGKSRLINGSLSDVTSGKTTSDNEGGVSGKKMNNRKVIFIGGGGVGGAVLGGAIGGGKGALIGGLLGAGGGFLGDRFTKGPEAEVKSGTEFGVYLNQGISLPRFAEGSEPVRQ
ncbi:hypothetical protein BH10ACI2_BH10ACI2_08300 [soil metagenome]